MSTPGRTSENARSLLLAKVFHLAWLNSCLPGTVLTDHSEALHAELTCEGVDHELAEKLVSAACEYFDNYGVAYDNLSLEFFNALP